MLAAGPRPPGSEPLAAARVWPRAAGARSSQGFARLEQVDPSEGTARWLALVTLSPAHGSGSNVMLAKILQMGKLRLRVCVCVGEGESAAEWGPGRGGPRDPQWSAELKGHLGRAGGDNGAPTPRWTMVATASSSAASFLSPVTSLPVFAARRAQEPPARPSSAGLALCVEGTSVQQALPRALGSAGVTEKG